VTALKAKVAARCAAIASPGDSQTWLQFLASRIPGMTYHNLAGLLNRDSMTFDSYKRVCRGVGVDWRLWLEEID